MILRHAGTDISNIYSKVTWSGDKSQVARKLEIDIAVNDHDKYLPKINFKLGDMVRFLTDDEKEIFQGYVVSLERSINSDTQSITCFDGLFFLTKSKGTYNFTGMTPQAITEKVAKDFGITLGSLENGSKLDRIFDAEIIYNIIMTAYSIESAKSNKQFMPRMNKGKLDIILKGNYKSKFVLDARTTVTNSTYSESMENSINRVKIFDAEGNEQGEVVIEGVPGVLQDIYKAEEGVDANVGAKALLKPIEQTASIEALGDIECITGNASIIKETFTGLDGLFYIDSDTHTWENHQHTMSLNLAFKNIMDYQMSGQDPADIKSNNTDVDVVSGPVASEITGKHRVWCFLKSKGFSNESAAAIMGNLEQESGIDPGKYQYGGGKGRGIMQWTVDEDRFASLQALAKKRGKTWKDLDTQLEFFFHELHNEKTGVRKLKKDFGLTPIELMHLKDINRAVIAFEGAYERAGDKQIPKRQRYAKGYLDKYKNASCSSNSISSSSKGSATTATGRVGDLIRAAETMLGYTYSRDRRFASNAADCSSLVLRAMAKIGLTTINKNLTTHIIHKDSRFYEIPRNQARAGDVVWHSGHMALVIGPGGQLIEASARAHKKVVYSKAGNRFPKAYRIRGLE